MQTIYQIKELSKKGEVLFPERFITQELCVRSLKLSYSQVAQVVPNIMLTTCTVLFNDKRKKPARFLIEAIVVFDTVVHL